MCLLCLLTQDLFVPTDKIILSKETSFGTLLHVPSLLCSPSLHAISPVLSGHTGHLVAFHYPETQDGPGVTNILYRVTFLHPT